MSLFSPQNIDVITSTKSATVKKLKNLVYKRKRRLQYRQTVVEGPRIIFDLLRNDLTRKLVDTILVDEEKVPEFVPQLEPYFSSSESSSSSSFQLLFATQHVLSECSDTVTPQGIVAVVDIPSFDNNKDYELRHKTIYNSFPLYLVLDGVSDPGNTGTLLRTALATGVSAIFLLPHSCDVWNPKAIRSAMSATFHMPSYSLDSWQQVEVQLKKRGVNTVWAATMIEDCSNCEEAENRSKLSKDATTASNSIAHYDVDWCGQTPTALVIGSEGAGLSSEIRQRLASRTGFVRAVHVPMFPKIESLNAAICGSVIMFEYFRQCHSKSINS